MDQMVLVFQLFEFISSQINDQNRYVNVCMQLRSRGHETAVNEKGPSGASQRCN